MSVSGYIGKNVKEPQLPREEEERQKEEEAKSEEAYGSVVDYDPVLRSHCRL